MLLALLLLAGCECGLQPPGPPKPRQLEPYALSPEDLRPFSRFTKPYHEHYTKLVEYNGAARDVPEPTDLSEVRIGFLGPLENHPDEALGRRMLNGSLLAIEEANARGGYCGKPFRLMIHNDQLTWGSSSNEIVKMTYDDRVWGMLGSISGDSTHIGLRVSLRTELPMVNSAATDPTIPETIIPWYLTTIQDDRVQSYTLARRIYTELGLKRVALLRVNDRYGRFGVIKFRDASRRLGHPVVIEQKYMVGDKDFRRQLRVIHDSRVDGIVIWGDAAPAGMILKQMREAGMKQRAFGSFRVLGDELFQIAGEAAEGLEIVYPFDPGRDDPAWLSFQERYWKRFQGRAEAFASLAFDAMNILLESICRAGLNRGRIRDAFTALEHYKGVTGEMTFDPNCKNIVPMYLATIRNGKPHFRRATMGKAYAQVGPAAYAGPPLEDVRGEVRIGVFGPGGVKAAAALGPSYIGVDADLPWGRASSELVGLLQDRHVIGLIATDRNSSHLAQQLVVKTFVPLIAISADRSLTAVNVPWVFRLPAGTPVEEAARCFTDALAKAGPNRERLRALLAASRFDARGEPR